MAKIADFGNSRSIHYGHLGINSASTIPTPKTHIYKQAGRLTARTEVERRQVYLDEMRAILDGADMKSLYTIIIQCLHDEPTARPSCADILSHSIIFCYIDLPNSRSIM